MFRISKLIRASIIIYHNSTFRYSDLPNKKKSFQVVSNLYYVPMQNISATIKQEISLLKNSITIISQKEMLSDEDKVGINCLITTVTHSIKNYNYDDLIKFLETYNLKPKFYRIPNYITIELIIEIENLFLRLCQENKIGKPEIFIFLNLFHNNFFIQNSIKFFNIIKNLFRDSFDTNDYLLFIESFSRVADKLNMKIKIQILQFLNIQTKLIPWQNIYFIYLISSFEFELAPNSFKSPKKYCQNLEKNLQTANKLSIIDQIWLVNCFQYQIYKKYEYRPQIKKIIGHIKKNLSQDVDIVILNKFIDTLLTLHKQKYQIISDPQQFFQKIQAIMRNLDETSQQSWKCFNNIVQYIHRFQKGCSRLQTETLKQLLLQKIITTKQKPRHYLRIIQYFISINYRSQDLIIAVQNIQNISQELTDIQLLRLWGCKKALNLPFDSNNRIITCVEKILQENPSKLIQSLNRNYLVYKHLQITKIAIDKTIKNINHKTYMYQLNNSLFSSFHIPQLKQHWLKSKQFIRIAKQQQFLVFSYTFIKNIHPFIGSRHVEILYDIFKFQNRFKKEFCFNLIKLFELYQFRRSFKQLELLIQFFFIKDIILQLEISNIYFNTKISVIKQAYMNNKYCYQTQNFIENCFNELIKNYSEDYILFLFIEQFNLPFISNIKDKYLKRYQLLNRNKNELSILVKKLEILNSLKNKNHFTQQEYDKLIQEYKGVIAANQKLHFLQFAFSKIDIPDTINQQQFLILVNPILSSANWNNIVKYLCNSNYILSCSQFLNLLKAFDHQLKPIIIFNFFIQKLNQVYEQMNQIQKIRTLIYFSQWRYPLEEILIQLLLKSQNICLIYPIFNLGYFKNDINQYLQIVISKKSLITNLYIFTPNEKIKLLSTFLSTLILKNNTFQQKNQIKILLQIIIEQSLENIFDPRLLLCLEILRFKYPQYQIQCQKIKSSIPKFKTALEHYLINHKKFQNSIFKKNHLQEAKLKLVDDLYLIKNDQFGVREEKIYTFTTKDSLILGKKHQFSGDFLLLIQYLKFYRSNNPKQIITIIIDRHSTNQYIIKSINHI